MVLLTPEGAVVDDLGRGIGVATNNIAEYKALIAGLELALTHGVSELEVFSDSELVVSQVKGEWKIRNDRLRTLAAEARRLLGRFDKFSLSHVPRELNADADKLANQGMDAAELEVAQDAEARQSSLFHPE